jgi:hypothetical protein
VDTPERCDIDYDFRLHRGQFMEMLPILDLIHPDGVWSDFPPVVSLYAEAVIVVHLDRDIVSQRRENTLEWVAQSSPKCRRGVPLFATRRHRYGYSASPT